jgi:hypothetical protein
MLAASFAPAFRRDSLRTLEALRSQIEASLTTAFQMDGCIVPTDNKRNLRSSKRKDSLYEEALELETLSDGDVPISKAFKGSSKRRRRSSDLACHEDKVKLRYLPELLCCAANAVKVTVAA